MKLFCRRLEYEIGPRTGLCMFVVGDKLSNLQRLTFIYELSEPFLKRILVACGTFEHSSEYYNFGKLVSMTVG